jgi:hypothetical protein
MFRWLLVAVIVGACFAIHPALGVIVLAVLLLCLAAG